jgi:hypothetical protein
LLKENIPAAVEISQVCKNTNSCIVADADGELKNANVDLVRDEMKKYYK